MGGVPIQVLIGIWSLPPFLLGLAMMVEVLLVSEVWAIKVGRLLPKVLIKGSLPLIALAMEDFFCCMDLLEEAIGVTSLIPV